DVTCIRLQSEDCVGNMLVATCAQLPENASSCEDHIRPSCRDGNRDESDLCQYQEESRRQCRSLYSNCLAQGHPVACEEKLESSCNNDCLVHKNRCAEI